MPLNPKWVAHITAQLSELIFPEPELDVGRCAIKALKGCTVLGQYLTLLGFLRYCIPQ